MPIVAGGSDVSAQIEARPLTPGSVNLVVYLMARQRLPVVRVRARSTDTQLNITPGACLFDPLLPPSASRTRSPPFPLRAVPLCSLVLHTARHGRYRVDVRILDAAGRDLVPPVHTTVRIGPAAR